MTPFRVAAALVLIALAAGGGWWAFGPRPVPADLAAIERGDLVLTRDEEGVARIREVYEVSAPVAGRLLRPPVKEGDRVKAGETVLAVLQPQEAGFLDPRGRREAEAELAAARAGLRLAEAELGRAMAEEAFWASEVARYEELFRRGAVADRTVEQTRLEHQLRAAAVETAMANIEVRRQEVARAEAHLTGPDETEAPEGACCLRLTAPVSGRVLEVAVESEQVVPAGALLMTVGDPADLEIEVDLLSSEAVGLVPGAPASIERWGGPIPLEARLRTVEPAAFTKISALGIEEQRVHVVLDLLTPPEARPGLGHDYRVFARITAERRENALIARMGALFRHDGGWAVFVAEDGRARLRPVTLGIRTARQAEVLEGLSEGDRVILHPSDRIADGVLVEDRTEM